MDDFDKTFILFNPSMLRILNDSKTLIYKATCGEGFRPSCSKLYALVNQIKTYTNSGKRNDPGGLGDPVFHGAW